MIHDYAGFASSTGTIYMVELAKRPIIETVNPASGAPGRVYRAHTVEEARRMLAAADKVQRDWRRTSFRERAALMRRAADVLRKRTDALCELMTAEMGKTLAGGRAEIEKCAFHCEHFADHAEEYL